VSNADVLRRIGALADDLQRSQVELTRESALAATNVYRAGIRSVVPSGRLRNVGKRGAAVGAGFDVLGTINPVAKIRARGPLQLVEWDTKPHRIIPKASRRLGGTRGNTRAQRSQSLYSYLFGGGQGYGSAALAIGSPVNDFRHAVNHPGSTGRRPWGRAEPAAVEAASVTWTRAGRRKLAQHLRGG
jgi:hypothetical protein